MRSREDWEAKRLVSQTPHETVNNSSGVQEDAEGCVAYGLWTFKSIRICGMSGLTRLETRLLCWIERYPWKMMREISLVDYGRGLVEEVDLCQERETLKVPSENILLKNEG